MSSLFASGSTTPQPLMTHDELRYRCPNCCARMTNIRAIERGNERAQHVYKCPRCSVIMTERPEGQRPEPPWYQFQLADRKADGLGCELGYPPDRFNLQNFEADALAAGVSQLLIRGLFSPVVKLVVSDTQLTHRLLFDKPFHNALQSRRRFLFVILRDRDNRSWIANLDALAL